MRESLLMIFTLFAFIGICFVVGIFTRNTEKDDKERDHVFMTFMRGLGSVLLVFGGLSIAVTIIYLLYSIFN